MALNTIPLGKNAISNEAISVIIAVRNGAHTIGEALTSVASQSHPASEVIVVDDGSADGSADLAETEMQRQNIPGEVIRLQRSIGAGAARNLAVMRCKGNILAVIDADDCWTEHHLFNAARAFAEHPDLAGYCSRVEMRPNTAWDLPGKTFPEDPGYAPEGPQDAYAALLKGLNIWNVTLCVRKAAFDEARGFEPSLRCYEDLWLILNIARLGKIHLDNSIGCVVRSHPESLSTSGLATGAFSMSSSMYTDRISLAKLLKEDARFHARDVRLFKEACVSFISNTLRDACRARNWDQATRIIRAVFAARDQQALFVARIFSQSFLNTGLSGFSLLLRKFTRRSGLNSRVKCQ